MDITGIYNLSDYQKMFDLQNSDLKKNILDYPGNISSFNSEMHQMGYRVISADPNYELSTEKMQVRAEEIYQQAKNFLQHHSKSLPLTAKTNLQQIFQDWEENKNRFLADYSQGKKDSRYQRAQLPRLPFKTDQFDLALCSHFNEKLVAELCRIANEVRLFPLLNEEGQVNPALGAIMANLQVQNRGVEIREVGFKKLQDANAMLRIWMKECSIN